MTTEQRNALRMIAQAFIDAVKVAGEQGAPAGELYSAVMDKLSLGQFTQIMATLVKAGKLTKRGFTYRYVADL